MKQDKSIPAEAEDQMSLAEQLSKKVDAITAPPAPPVFSDAEIKLTEEPTFRDKTEEERKAEKDAATEAAEEIPVMPANMIAATGVGLLELLQMWSLSFIHKKRLFTDRDLELMKQGIPRPGVSYDLDSEEERLRVKIANHEKMKDELSFSDEQRNVLNEAFTNYFKVTQIKMSPETVLIGTVVSVVGVNAYQAFTSK